MTALAFRSVPLEERAGVIWTALAGCEIACDWSGCLFWPAEGVLVVSDLHLEKGASLAARGHLAPPYDTIATLERLAERIADWRAAHGRRPWRQLPCRTGQRPHAVGFSCPARPN